MNDMSMTMFKGSYLFVIPITFALAEQVITYHPLRTLKGG